MLTLVSGLLLLFFSFSCAFVCQVATLLKRGWSWDDVCFCAFPSTFLLSLIIHDMRQRNELGGLDHKDGLQQNQCFGNELTANNILLRTSSLRLVHLFVVQFQLKFCYYLQ